MAAIHDGHIHLTSAEVDARANAAALLVDLDSLGIERAAVVTPSTMAWDNSVTFAALRDHPDRFVAIARVDVNSPIGLEDLERVLDDGAAGIRLTLLGVAEPPPLTGPIAEEMARVLADRAAVVEFHCSPEQLGRVGAFAAAHPDVQVLIDHLGRPEPGTVGSDAQRSFLRLSELPNVSAKSPGLGFFSREPFPHRDMVPFITAAIDRFGAHRIMWGSDWPGCFEFGPYSNTLEGARAALASRSTAERDLVLGGTFERLLLRR